MTDDEPDGEEDPPAADGSDAGGTDADAPADGSDATPDSGTEGVESETPTDPLTDVETDTRTRTVSDDEATADEAGGEPTADVVCCSSCGERIDAGAEVCPNCGVRQTSAEKEPLLAALLSFIVPGAGQLYNGQVGRGAVAFVGVLVADFVLTVVAIVLTLIVIGPLLFLLIPVVHAVVAYDAYHQAELINEGKVAS
ncbi:MAG: hypothetical protein ABEJ61_09315 [Haloferacaceae archaeon]